jgi:uncharacterized protein (DUF2126 family)
MLRFMNFPESGDLKPWSTQIHDRFLLPHLLQGDFRQVLADLRAAGLPFQPEWFVPLIERRFPLLGRAKFQDITLELHQAHEPWPVLAEEVSGSGVTRFLDLANDRIQVRGTGLTPERHILECNGERVPLRATATAGEQVAGVRFKARNPPATLHPTLPATAALVFDLIDSWSHQVIGGFTYIPAQPDSWGSMGMPFVAESRWGGQPAPRNPPPTGLPSWNQAGQFILEGSGRKTAQPPDEKIIPEQPFLLDLSISG